MTSKTSAAGFVIPSLDGLRALSFLLVFMGHAGLSWIPGGFGVSVFFFLSGYLITTLMRMEWERTGRVDLKLFYLRRALRIWPPFYLVLCAGIGLVFAGVLEANFELSSLAAQALHAYNYWTIVHGWTGVVPGSGVYWSLAVEEHFYLLFPALYIALRRSSSSPVRQFQAFMAICVVIMLWRCLLVFGWHVTQVERTFVATDTRFDSILFGCGLAVYRNPALDAETRERPTSWEALGLCAGLATLVFSFLYRSDTFRESVRYSLQGIALYPVFSTAVRFPRWWPYRVLNLRPLQFLGTLSYSAYLVHYTILDAVEDWLRESLARPIRSTIAFAICFVVSYAMWHFVEEPFAAIRRNLSRSLGKQVAAKAAGPAVG